VTAPHRGTPCAALLGVFMAALAVRAAIGWMARGHGEMEGLSYRYERDAYAMAAGYGLSHPKVGAPPQVDLIALADSLGQHGERITPRAVPPKDPARWRPTTLHPPGYAGFLLALYRVVGEPLVPWAIALQALLDSAACVALFWIVRPLLGARVGLFTAWACALFPPCAYLATSHVADALVPTLLIATFGLWTLALRTRHMRWFAASGLALGVLCLFRPDFLLFPAAMLVGALLNAPARTAWIGTGIVAAVAVLVLVPWGLRNQRVNGTFNLTTHASGMTLYGNIGEFPNPYGIVFDDDWIEQQARQAGFEEIDDPAADRWFKGKALAIARENPGLLARNAARRILSGVAPLYHWGYVNPAYKGHGIFDHARLGESPVQFVLRHPREFLAAYWDRIGFALLGLVLTLSSLALIAFDRTRWHVGVLLALPFAYVVLSHAPFLLGTRFFVPAVFGQFAALGAWIERLSRRTPTEGHA